MWPDQLREDLRHALRALARTPGFALVTVLTLAVAIGFNTAIFSVVDGVLLRPLAFPHSDRLVRLFEAHVDGRRSGVSAPDFADWRKMSGAFETLGAIHSRPVTFAGAADPERIIVMNVTPEFFALFGASLALGQPFQPADYQSLANAALGPVVPPVPGDVATVIISHELWQRQFGSDPNVVGRRVQTQGLPAIVAGVMQRNSGFDATPIGVAECWIPLVESTLAGYRRMRQLVVVGRLKRDVSVETAQAEMTAIAASLEREHPADNRGWNVQLTSLHDSIVGEARVALLVLLAGVGCVLIIACANVTNLFLLRGVARSREVAVRVALGAGRARLVRQWLTESMLLALAGGMLGLAVTFWAVPALVAYAPQSLPRTNDIVVDRRILVFCLIVSVGTGIISGLAPAITAQIGNAIHTLRAMSSVSAPRWLWVRHALVVAQVGLAIVLLIGAGLMVRTVLALHAVDLGFEPRGVLTFGVDDLRGRMVSRSFSRVLVERLQTLPGVRAAGVGGVPLLGAVGNQFTPENGREDVQALADIPSPGYFSALGFRLLDGRFFSDADSEGSDPVVIVNRAFARAAWGTDRVVGRRVRVDRSAWLTVVGVVHDVRMTSLEAEPAALVYMPFAQPRFATFSNYVVRTDGDPASLLPLIRATVRDIDPAATLTRIATMNERLAQAMAARTFNSWLIGLYSLAALVLAVIGLYALISESVAGRTAEIGVRMALGARRAEVVRLVVSRSLALTALGLALGLAAAAGATQYLEGMVFGLTPFDPLTFSLVPFVFIAAAALAAAVPARRAARVDPVVALRCE